MSGASRHRRGGRGGGPRRGSRGGARLGPPPPGLFHDILLAPDRERIPEAHPLVSFRPEDELAFATEVDRRALFRFQLRRRGVEHGSVAQLRPEGLLGPRPRRRRRETIAVERWCAAQPILLPGAASDVATDLDARRLDALRETLSDDGGLRRHLGAHRDRLAPHFEVRDLEAPRFDPERDLARAILAAQDGPDDLWIKVGRLSTHPEDRSLRARLSFGREGDDDASADGERHRLVSELARLLLPGAAQLSRLEEVGSVLERHVGAPVFGTQHIAYWNAPNGGARFHHDAFGGTPQDPSAGQHAVVYAQLTGRTVWLALSIEELGARLREFLRWIEEGDVPELRAVLGDGWSEVREAAAGRAGCLAELGRPDGGRFEPVLNAPEFTGFLADAGHALALHPGDVLLLPNHGLERTAMHSVFSGSKQPGYALSVAVRRR